MNCLTTETAIESLDENNLPALTGMTVEWWPDSRYDEELHYWKSLIGSMDHYCALARQGKVYSGFIHLSVRHDYVEGAATDRTAYLEGIYVKPGYRKQGTARCLLASAERWARSKGLTQLASDTAIENSCSQHFHQQTGFRETNRLVCYLKNL